MNEQRAYLEKPGSYFGEERREMLAFVPTQAQTILEIGCGRGGFAAALKSARKVHVTGLEPFLTAAAEARTIVDRLIDLDVENGIRQLAGETFDCIVFNDVLEHLVDPWAVLRDVKELLAPRGTVVASVPNMRYAPVLWALMFKGEWRYREDGVMDKTHLRFFTVNSVSEMFASCGYRVRQLRGINPGRSWQFSTLRALSFAGLSDIRYRQIAITAQS